MNNNQNNKSGQRNSSDNNSVKNNQKKGNNSNLGSMSTDESSTDRKKNKEAQAVENSDKSRTESIVKNSQENEKSQGGDSSVEEPGTSEETSKKNTNVNPEKANVNPGLSEQKGPSTNELRAEIRTAMNRDDYQVAWEQTKKLLEREPESQDFYRAAFLQRELTEASEKGLKFINQAISSKQTVPPKYKLIKTDFLLSQKRNQMAEKLLTEISSPMLEELNSNKQSYYYYLNGELQRKKGNNEKAFFEYIESVRSSEDSVWGRKSRKILNNEL